MKKTLVTIIGFVFLGFLCFVLYYYWFNLRPTQAKADCGKVVAVNTKGGIDNAPETIGLAYEICLKKKGI